MRGGAKCRVLTSSLSMHGGAYSGTLKSKKKSLSPPIPVGGGGVVVVTNDWCINISFS